MPYRVELDPKVSVGRLAVSVNDADDGSGDERREDGFESIVLSESHEGNNEEQSGSDADLCGGVL